jgi:hypothetical protein
MRAVKALAVATLANLGFGGVYAARRANHEMSGRTPNGERQLVRPPPRLKSTAVNSLPCRRLPECRSRGSGDRHPS